jgi:LCP family protein required for cell wall assembly
MFRYRQILRKTGILGVSRYMKRNQSIPPNTQSVDGMIGGSKHRRSRRRDFDEPFIKRRQVSPDEQKSGATSASHVQHDRSVKLSRRDKRRLARSSEGSVNAKKPKRVWRWVKRAFIILLILVLVGGGYFAFKSYAKLRGVFKGGGSSAVVCGEVPADQLQAEGDGRVNILLLGVGGDEHAEGTNLSDSMMVMSINPLNNTVALLSLPRDLWVPVDGEYMKINAAYQQGMFDYQAKNKGTTTKDWPVVQAGLRTVDSVVSEAIGIPINFNVLIDFRAFEEAIDAVGGIDITVPEKLVDYNVAWENGWSPVIAEAGPQHMESDQALLYVRSRYGSARGDFDRAERQRAVIVALQKEVLSAGTLANPVKVSQLIDALGDNIRTDIGGEERTCLINTARKVDSSTIDSVDLYDHVEGDTVRGQSVQVPKAGIYDYSEVQAFVRTTLRDSYIAKENAEITVLNGTNTVGLAEKVANELKSYGYNVKKVGDAPTKTYTTTQIVDASSEGKPTYTLHYLERRLGGEQTTTLPNGISAGTAKIVILVGNDASSN